MPQEKMMSIFRIFAHKSRLCTYSALPLHFLESFNNEKSASPPSALLPLCFCQASSGRVIVILLSMEDRNKTFWHRKLWIFTGLELCIIYPDLGTKITFQNSFAFIHLTSSLHLHLWLLSTHSNALWMRKNHYPNYWCSWELSVLGDSFP